MSRIKKGTVSDCSNNLFRMVAARVHQSRRTVITAPAQRQVRRCSPQRWTQWPFGYGGRKPPMYTARRTVYSCTAHQDWHSKSGRPWCNRLAGWHTCMAAWWDSRQDNWAYRIYEAGSGIHRTQWHLRRRISQKDGRSPWYGTPCRSRIAPWRPASSLCRWGPR